MGFFLFSVIFPHLFVQLVLFNKNLLFSCIFPFFLSFFELVGHSQGETAYHVMASERPEYNDKILFNVALAPPIYMGNSSHPLVQMAVQNLDLLQVSPN